MSGSVLRAWHLYCPSATRGQSISSLHIEWHHVQHSARSADDNQKLTIAWCPDPNLPLSPATHSETGKTAKNVHTHTTLPPDWPIASSGTRWVATVAARRPAPDHFFHVKPRPYAGHMHHRRGCRAGGASGDERRRGVHTATSMRSCVANGAGLEQSRPVIPTVLRLQHKRVARDPHANSNNG